MDLKIIPSTIRVELVKLIKDGDDLMESGNYSIAEQTYLSAFKMIPEVKAHYELSFEILLKRSDAFFALGNFDKSKTLLESIMKCYDGIGNPYCHLRLGQNYYNLSMAELAKDELIRAYMGGGKDIFDDEDDKYFNSIIKYI